MIDSKEVRNILAELAGKNEPDKRHALRLHREGSFFRLDSDEIEFRKQLDEALDSIAVRELEAQSVLDSQAASLSLAAGVFQNKKPQSFIGRIQMRALLQSTGRV